LFERRTRHFPSVCIGIQQRTIQVCDGDDHSFPLSMVRHGCLLTYSVIARLESENHSSCGGFV
jgi:hypothetical protein